MPRLVSVLARSAAVVHQTPSRRPHPTDGSTVVGSTNHGTTKCLISNTETRRAPDIEFSRSTHAQILGSSPMGKTARQRAPTSSKAFDTAGAMRLTGCRSSTRNCARLPIGGWQPRGGGDTRDHGACTRGVPQLIVNPAHNGGSRALLALASVAMRHVLIDRARDGRLLRWWRAPPHRSTTTRSR